MREVPVANISGYCLLLYAILYRNYRYWYVRRRSFDAIMQILKGCRIRLRYPSHMNFKVLGCRCDCFFVDKKPEYRICCHVFYLFFIFYFYFIALHCTVVNKTWSTVLVGVPCCVGVVRAPWEDRFDPMCLIIDKGRTAGLWPSSHVCYQYGGPRGGISAPPLQFV